MRCSLPCICLSSIWVLGWEPFTPSARPVCLRATSAAVMKTKQTLLIGVPDSGKLDKNICIISQRTEEIVKTCGAEARADVTLHPPAEWLLGATQRQQCQEGMVVVVVVVVEEGGGRQG
ncbi:unnamed protein product [Pleuronectes platessa]|uniref:Uncharacterized protein n=1 Tax=Pleuronectes platessa TaxID=8262 RepID=A0A9N7VD03_PLEPL|nr:unnamed protein product [Pleuronectes platessa]